MEAFRKYSAEFIATFMLLFAATRAVGGKQFLPGRCPGNNLYESSNKLFNYFHVLLWVEPVC